MVDLVFDFGNARGKWFNPKTGSFDSFRHAMAVLSDEQWKQVVGRGKPPAGYIKVNGQAYVIGDAARRHTIKQRPTGATRYQSTYYGVFLAYALSLACNPTKRPLTLFVSHAPRDIDYADHLKAAARNVWTIETENGPAEYRIGTVMTFDEPIGGYMHYALTEKGTLKKKSLIADATVLTIDVGGYTVDAAAVDPGGLIDPASLDSTVTGVINMTDKFEKALRSKNSLRFRDAGPLDIRRVENALLTGHYKFGKVDIDCKQEASAALNELTDDVVQMINAHGGIANYDYVLLTGGGAALLVNNLQNALPQAEFLLAEDNMDRMMFANVFGGAKIAALLKAEGEM
jgi:hypothetical protein